MKLEVIKESVKGCNYAASNFLFRCYGSRIVCFEIVSGAVKWEAEQEYTINQDGVFFNDDTAFLVLEDGELLALDIATGKLKWRQSKVGRVTLFKDKIYCIADYAIKELAVETGTILREESMEDLTEKYNFHPTGTHKVYDDYIFSIASGTPGLIAIYDRKSLKFRSMVELEEMVLAGKDSLIWYEGRLYILDFVKTVHVFSEVKDSAL